jgi:hypothetical protein
MAEKYLDAYVMLNEEYIKILQKSIYIPGRAVICFSGNRLDSVSFDKSELEEDKERVKNDDYLKKIQIPRGKIKKILDGARAFEKEGDDLGKIVSGIPIKKGMPFKGKGY